MVTNFKYAQVQNFSLAGAGTIIGATTIVLKSFQTIDGVNLAMTDFGALGFGTLEPGNGVQEEQFSFTGVTQNANGTATLTGVKTVLFLSPYTATSGLAKTHAGSTTMVISNTSGFYDQFPAKDNDETITGQWTFDVFPITPSNSDASTTVKGVTKLSVAPASATDPIAVGTNDSRIPIAYAVDSVGTDAYAILPSPAITAYVAGQIFTFKVGTANTGAATLAVSGLSPITIKKNVSSDLSTGDILANQIVTVVYDGTNMQIVSKTSTSNTYPSNPTVQTFTGASSSLGSVTTQFDITNPSGTTFRYTWDGTGTDPGISAATVPVDSVVLIYSSSITVGNLGSFIVTGSGTNYFEVTNSNGNAENDKTLAGGFLKLITAQTYTTPAGVKYAIVEVQAGGGAGGGSQSDGQLGTGGGGGGYARKIVSVATLGASQTVRVGVGGTGVAGNVQKGGTVNGGGGDGAISRFGTIFYATGGKGGQVNDALGTGGIGVSGDINLEGGDGGASSGGSTGVSPIGGGIGGSSHFGGGGAGGAENSRGGKAGNLYGGGGGGSGNNSSSDNQTGGDGAIGIIVITEYYN